MSPLTLVVPMPPNLANGRMHHMVKHKLKCGYWALLDLIFGHGYDHAAVTALDAVEQRTKSATLRREITTMRDVAARLVVATMPNTLRGLGPKPPGWTRAAIRSVMYLGAHMDDGNAMNRHKWVEDWLTERGYIVDDRKKCLTWEAFPEQIVKRDGQYRIEITLTPLSPSTP